MVEAELREALEGALPGSPPPLVELILDVQAAMLTPGQIEALPNEASDQQRYSPDHQDEGQRSE